VAVTISAFRTEFSVRPGLSQWKNYAGGVTEFLTKGEAADGLFAQRRVQRAASLSSFVADLSKPLCGYRTGGSSLFAILKQRKFVEPRMGNPP